MVPATVTLVSASHPPSLFLWTIAGIWRRPRAVVVLAERGHPSPTLPAPGLPQVQGPLGFVFSISIIHKP